MIPGSSVPLGDVVANFDERTVVELKESNRFTGALAECAHAVNKGDTALFEQKVKMLPVAGEVWTKTLSKTDDDNVPKKVLVYTRWSVAAHLLYNMLHYGEGM